MGCEDVELKEVGVEEQEAVTRGQSGRGEVGRRARLARRPVRESTQQQLHDVQHDAVVLRDTTASTTPQVSREDDIRASGMGGVRGY